MSIKQKSIKKTSLGIITATSLALAYHSSTAQDASTIHTVLANVKSLISHGRSAVGLRLVRMLAAQDQPKLAEGRAAVDFYSGVSDELKAANRLSNAQLAYPQAPVERLQPLLELGDPFLGNGPIRPGIKTPFGQMLQPSFLLFGSLRSAFQQSEINNVTTADWSNRLDLHGNLNLSGTERLLFSMRPLDSEAGNNSGYQWQGIGQEGWHNDLNARITKLYFEGDFGEIFPNLDPSDSKTFDIGFSVGRQLMKLQDGMLFNDIIDMAGITRNSLVFPGVSNMRLTGFYAWNHLNRGNNDVQDQGAIANNTHRADAYGLSAEADTALDNTMNFDALYVNDPQDKNAWYLGLSSKQRMGGWLNSTFRVNVSLPENGESANVKQGELLLAQLSATLSKTDNLLYWNTFWDIDQFTSAARTPDQGNPVANLGILFGPVGIGRYGVALGQSLNNTVGSVLGYQIFLDGINQQLIVELGGRSNTEGDSNSAGGIGARYQISLAKRHVLHFDTFAAVQEQEGFGHGFRTEWQIKF